MILEPRTITSVFSSHLWYFCSEDIQWVCFSTILVQLPRRGGTLGGDGVPSRRFSHGCCNSNDHGWGTDCCHLPRGYSDAPPHLTARRKAVTRFLQQLYATAQRPTLCFARHTTYCQIIARPATIYLLCTAFKCGTCSPVPLLTWYEPSFLCLSDSLSV